MTRTSLLSLSFLAVAHALCAQPFEVSATNSARYLGSGHWEWTIYLLADAGVLSQIHCVEYKLPSTFPNPNREVCQRGSAGQPFALTAEGYGELSIHLRIRYTNTKTQDFDHDLKLVDTRCPSPLDQFTLKEGETHAVKGISPPVYVYADEIHEKTDSHFRLFRTSRPLPQPRQVPEFLKQLKKLHSGHGLVLDPDTYLKFNLSPLRGQAEMAVPLGPKETIGLLASEPSSHKAINIRVCR